MQDILICKPSMESDGAADVLVVGAGLTGLCVARALSASGARVRVLDKGRGVGGRCATRRFDGAVFDHGLQALDLADEPVRSMLDALLPRGWIGQAGLRSTPDGLIGVNGITAIAKVLASGLDVSLATQVEAVAATSSGWHVRGEGVLQAAPMVVITAPVPQALALVEAGGLTLDPGLRAALAAIRYSRSAVAMATLDPAVMSDHPGDHVGDHGAGHLTDQLADQPADRVADQPMDRIGSVFCTVPNSAAVARIAFNHHKGISPVPAVTVHATPDWSDAHWDLPAEQRAAELLAAAQQWLPGTPRRLEGHGWRYARYAFGWAGEACVALDAAGTLLLSGDALGGGDVAGAVQSAAAVVARLGVA